MKALSIPPIQSHAGWWSEAGTACRLCRATSSTTTPVTPATTIAKPSASIVPTRSPSFACTAAWIVPAMPADAVKTAAIAVPPDTGQPYKASAVPGRTTALAELVEREGDGALGGQRLAALVGLGERGLVEVLPDEGQRFVVRPLEPTHRAPPDLFVERLARGE